jgi:hypothetical protein
MKFKFVTSLFIAFPQVCDSFYGIKIEIRSPPREHHKFPHFHAKKGGKEISVMIETLEVIEENTSKGKFPERAKILVLTWAKLHQEELKINWELCQTGQKMKRIDPLP